MYIFIDVLIWECVKFCVLPYLCLILHDKYLKTLIIFYKMAIDPLVLLRADLTGTTQTIHFYFLDKGYIFVVDQDVLFHVKLLLSYPYIKDLCN